MIKTNQKELFTEKLQKKIEKQKARVFGVAGTPNLNLSDILEDLVEISDEKWGTYAFANEPLREKFTSNERKALSKQAIECGKAQAREYRKKYPNYTIDQIAKAMGVKVTYPDIPDRGLGGGQVLFARFINPNRIEVFTDCTKKAYEAIKNYNLYNILQVYGVKEVLTAHELFHYIEEIKSKTIFTQTKTIDVRPFGIFHNHSKILCLSEIAAMAFTKEILGLSYSPYIFDVMLVYLYNKQVACNLYVQIKTITGHDSSKNRKLEFPS